MSDQLQFYRFVKASDGFCLSGVPVAGFPIIIRGAIGVCPSAFAYIRECGIYRNQSLGTLLDVAGILCAWFNYLDELDLTWDQATIVQFLRWSKQPTERISERRRSRRAEVVFSFYEFSAPDTAEFSAARALVEELAEPLPPEAVVYGAPIRRRLRLRSTRRSTSAMRPTPSAEDVEMIGEALLEKGPQLAKVRNWLLVQTAYETNLRAQGIAQLTLGHVHTMLSDRRITDLPEALTGASIQRARSDIRAKIDDVEKRGYRNFICDGIFEKGKTRSVFFPVELMRQILEYVWFDRWKLVEGRRVSETASLSSPLWLSAKTSNRLAVGSIADILKDGFELAGVAGSGHRLRAAHAVRLLRGFVQQARRNGGGKFDAEAILERVKERMGHAHPETLRPYLHTVMLEDLVDE